MDSYRLYRQTNLSDLCPNLTAMKWYPRVEQRIDLCQ